jgi:DNA modification methylase
MTDNTDISPFGFYHENALNLVDRLENEFDDTTDLVDVIITSPPYADLIDYGDEAEQIGKQSYESFLEDLQEVFKQCYEVAADDATLWIITDTYRKDGRLVRLPFDIADDIENLHDVEVCQADDCDGILLRDRQNGHRHCPECDAEYDPTEDSWRMGDHIIWNKQRTRPWRQKGQFRNIYEHISMYSKSDKDTYNIDDIRITDTDDFGRWWVDYPER